MQLSDWGKFSIRSLQRPSHGPDSSAFIHIAFSPTKISYINTSGVPGTVLSHLQLFEKLFGCTCSSMERHARRAFCIAHREIFVWLYGAVQLHPVSPT
mmetsp:Transcript_21725/g.62297  ORF Transcript_21725/g.62297 Transcript_21725/m.62297 type:complete len:98 (-) Transcript_21725:132-425(-)